MIMYILTDYKLIILALLPFKNQLWSLQMNITHTLDIILLNCKFFDSGDKHYSCIILDFVSKLIIFKMMPNFDSAP